MNFIRSYFYCIIFSSLTFSLKVYISAIVGLEINVTFSSMNEQKIHVGETFGYFGINFSEPQCSNICTYDNLKTDLYTNWE